VTRRNQTRQVESIKEKLAQCGSEAKAKKIQRYFSEPESIITQGAMAADLRRVITEFHQENAEFSPDQVLQISEALLKKAFYSEEVLVAFGILNKLVKRNFNDDLLSRFEYWLEHYASNWGHVDDLCIKTIYQFFLSRTHLIETIQPWSKSKVPWCRRASNVAWVKFIKRPIGSNTYFLNKALVFENCDFLMSDKHIYVQKSIGWLLKVTAKHHEGDVLHYLRTNAKYMKRSTARYALEKVSKESRERVLSKACS
jgi:3-methyladenine DNA glycosylase AlkD